MLLDNPIDTELIFREQQSRKCEFRTDRGLRNRISSAGYEYTGYQGQFLGITDQSPTEIINARIAQTGQVRLLDVGCGKGHFLLDVAGVFGDAVKCTGISPYPYHKPSKFAGMGITYVSTFIEDYNPEARFDVITAVHVLQYPPDPLQALRKIYDLLTPGGVALIAPIAVNVQQETDILSLLKYLEEDYLACTKSYGQGRLGLVISKTTDSLYIPMEVIGQVERKVNSYDRSYYQAVYRYNG